MTTITRPGPTNLQNEPGYELDLLWDQMADVVEATEVVANAALPAATAATTYAPIAKGVTNGDSHNHDGGDGGQIAYSVLSGLPTLGTAAALNVGTAASNVVQLNGSAQLPAVDGSLLTNLPGGGLLFRPTTVEAPIYLRRVDVNTTARQLEPGQVSTLTPDSVFARID